MGSVAKHEIHRISHPTAAHRSWVAVATGGVRGTATLVLAADGIAELAFVVEDDWQRHGVGRALAAAVLAEAARLRIPTVTAYVQAENWRARQFFRDVAPEADARLEDREVVVRIPVAVDLAPSAPDRSSDLRRLAKHA
jgi:GNAT superfamily N-acetyltransferase